MSLIVPWVRIWLETPFKFTNIAYDIKRDTSNFSENRTISDKVIIIINDATTNIRPSFRRAPEIRYP